MMLQASLSGSKQALSDRDGEQKTANELAARFRQQLSASAMSRRISDFYTALAH
jgi:hypothetical protein